MCNKCLSTQSFFIAWLYKNEIIINSEGATTLEYAIYFNNTMTLQMIITCNKIKREMVFNLS